MALLGSFPERKTPPFSIQVPVPTTPEVHDKQMSVVFCWNLQGVRHGPAGLLLQARKSCHGLVQCRIANELRLLRLHVPAQLAPPLSRDGGTLSSQTVQDARRREVEFHSHRVVPDGYRGPHVRHQ